MRWVTSWAASVQGPYPVGSTLAQPDLSRAFPDAARGAREQSFRMIVRPSLWGEQIRVRFSNAFGTRPVTFSGAHLGLQHSGAAVVAGTNQAVTFNHARSVTVVPGEHCWSDPVPFPPGRRGGGAVLAGRKLGVSFHVEGESGPITWHAKALQTSYVSAPDVSPSGHDEGESMFPFGTTAWYFVDALDVMAPDNACAIVAFGDSITDGTSSTLNGDDRWPDVLARRLAGRKGARVAIVNAGIGGNQVVGPAQYTARNPYRGGPAALQRLERDVISLSGVKTVIWLEGNNDFSRNGNAGFESVRDGMIEGVARLRAGIAGVRIIGATLISALGSTSEAHGFPEQDAKRRALNDYIRTADIFDGVIDFDRAILDPATGGMQSAFVPDSTVGGPGDRLHPNRLGYLAMGMCIDLDALLGAKRRLRRRG